MKNYTITENQLKKLIENIILKEEIDIYALMKDQRARMLIDFLNEKHGDIYGIGSIDEVAPLHHSEDIDTYTIGNDNYLVLTDEEANQQTFELAKEMIFDDPFYFVGIKDIIKLSPVLENNKLTYEILSVIEKYISGETYRKNIELYRYAYKILDLFIGDYDKFVKNIIKQKGRIGFMSLAYVADKEEFYNGYFIYKIEL